MLVARRTGTLAQAEQDAAPAPAGGNRVLLLGGLTPADTSSDAITLAGPTGGRVVGRLPGALHDAAAARLGGSVYLFGGGNGTRQLDQILRVPLTGGSAVPVGRLPAPELGSNRRRDRQHRVHRRRLHGNALAEHDRRLHPGTNSAHRRAPPLHAALRRGHRRRRPARDRRRLARERHGKRRRARVRALRPGASSASAASRRRRRTPPQPRSATPRTSSVDEAQRAVRRPIKSSRSRSARSASARPARFRHRSPISARSRSGTTCSSQEDAA